MALEDQLGLGVGPFDRRPRPVGGLLDQRELFGGPRSPARCVDAEHRDQSPALDQRHADGRATAHARPGRPVGRGEPRVVERVRDGERSAGAVAGDHRVAEGPDGVMARSKGRYAPDELGADDVRVVGDRGVEDAVHAQLLAERPARGRLHLRRLRQRPQRVGQARPQRVPTGGRPKCLLRPAPLRQVGERDGESVARLGGRDAEEDVDAVARVPELAVQRLAGLHDADVLVEQALLAVARHLLEEVAFDEGVDRPADDPRRRGVRVEPPEIDDPAGRGVPDRLEQHEPVGARLLHRAEPSLALLERLLRPHAVGHVEVDAGERPPARHEFDRGRVAGQPDRPPVGPAEAELVAILAAVPRRPADVLLHAGPVGRVDVGEERGGDAPAVRGAGQADELRRGRVPRRVVRGRVEGPDTHAAAGQR